MSNQGEQPLTRRGKLVTAVGVGLVIAVIAAVGIGIGVGTAAHAAQVKAEATKAMTSAIPAYQGAITLGGDLDDLAAKSTEAKKAYDAEQARLAEEAAKAAELQRQQEAAAEAQRQAEAQEAAEADQQPSSPEQPTADDNAPSSSEPVRCPAGSQANSNDGVNDTSCFPVVCFTIQVPDPAHPECDVAFKP